MSSPRTPRRIRSLLAPLTALALAALPRPAEGKALDLPLDGLIAPEVPASSARVRLLARNEDAWYARWLLASEARETIDVQYFVFRPDLFGKSFLGLLRRKAAEGVRVRLMIDARGSSDLARRLREQVYLRELVRMEGVEVRVFRPWHRSLLELPRDVRRVLASNHDKILVVDGKRALVGGRNLSRSYFTPPADDAGAYRDCDVMLEGAPVASKATRAFELEWGHRTNYRVHPGWFDRVEDQGAELDLARRAMQRWIQGRGVWEPTGRYAEVIRAQNAELVRYPGLTSYDAFTRDPWGGAARGVEVKLLDKDTLVGETNEITGELLRLIDAAEETIHIQSAYLVLTARAREALARAGRRGVRITIHTNSPASSRSHFTQAFFLKEWWTLLRDIPNLEIAMQVNRHKVHAKVLTFDDAVLWVSSYNLDPMSETINSEVATVVASPSLARRMRLRIEADVAQSTLCRIRVEPDGRVVRVHGPEDYLEGSAGWKVRWVSRLGFLRPLV